MTDRELDVLFGEKVMGLPMTGLRPAGFYDGCWTVFNPDGAMCDSPRQPTYRTDNEDFDVVPFYSTSIAAASEGVEEMNRNGVNVVLVFGGDGNMCSASVVRCVAAPFGPKDLPYHADVYMRRTVDVSVTKDRFLNMPEKVRIDLQAPLVKGESQQPHGKMVRAIVVAGLRAVGVEIEE